MSYLPSSPAFKSEIRPTTSGSSVINREVGDNLQDSVFVQGLMEDFYASYGSYLDKPQDDWKSQLEVRKVLHPAYKSRLSQVKSARNLTESVKVYAQKRPFTNYRKLLSHNPSPSQKNYKPTVNNDGTPYQDPFRKKLIDDQLNKKKWISHRDFNTTIKLRTSMEYKSKDLLLSPSIPTSSHNFRDVNKPKWMAGSFKS